MACNGIVKHIQPDYDAVIKRYAGGKKNEWNVISVGKHRHKKCGKDVISVNIVAIVLVGFFLHCCV